MSAKRAFEPWEEIHRHGQDLADRLAQGFTGLLHHSPIISPPPFAWPNPHKPPFDPDLLALKRDLPPAAVDGVSAIFDIGNRLGQAGAELGACINGVVQQFFRRIPVPFWSEEGGSAAPPPPAMSLAVDLEGRGREGELGRRGGEEVGSIFGAAAGLDELADQEGFCFDPAAHGNFSRPQGSINITSTYDSGTQDIESSLVARGDLWRAEASHGGSTSGNENSPLFLIQLGPVLFVRDTTLLLPVHLSKQHLLWYGYDRKNGMHSLCPALWSKHRRYLLMSMICLNPFACSFLDLQFPNGQLTYVAGEGLTTAAFLPAFGGLLQVQGQYPGDTRFSFSCKTKRGSCITPTVQWPDKSFSLGVVQALAWKRSGLMLRPTIQVSVCPTFGGSNPGLRAEIIHSVKEKVSVICGGSFTAHPCAFASLSLGRSKWNGHVGRSGIVVRVETPLSNVGRSSFSIQLNSGLEF